MKMKRDIESTLEWMRRKICSQGVILAVRCAMDVRTRPIHEGVQQSSKITWPVSWKLRALANSIDRGVTEL